MLAVIDRRPVGSRDVRVRKHDDLLGWDTLELDHPLAIALGHRDEDVRQAADDVTVEEPSHRLPLVGPRLLMRDHDRHAGDAAEDRPPQVGAEHVRVDDVDGLVAKEGHKSPKRHHVEAAGAGRVRGKGCPRAGVSPEAGRSVGRVVATVTSKRSRGRCVASATIARSAPPPRPNLLMSINTRRRE